jgi:DNA polymerase III delta prime subunit
MVSVPWIEKYRPLTFEEIVLTDYIKDKFTQLSIDNFPNILIFGPPGTGKTTTAITICKKILSDPTSYIELNASDNRGINMINDFIQGFCKKRNDEKIKIVILDEADNITKKAQEQLINFIENYSFIKFIFTCNDSNQIIETLQSRCLLIKFNKPSVSDTRLILKKISSEEKLSLSNDVINDILVFSDFDIRKSINNLEAMSSLYKEINHKSIKKFFNNPSIQSTFDILNILIFKKDINTAFKKFLEIMNEGVNVYDFVVCTINILQEYDEFKEYFDKINIDKDLSILILEKYHDTYYKILKTVESKLQIINLFHKIMML